MRSLEAFPASSNTSAVRYSATRDKCQYAGARQAIEQPHHTPARTTDVATGGGQRTTRPSRNSASDIKKAVKQCRSTTVRQSRLTENGSRVYCRSCTHTTVGSHPSLQPQGRRQPAKMERSIGSLLTSESASKSSTARGQAEGSSMTKITTSTADSQGMSTTGNEKHLQKSVDTTDGKLQSSTR